jgi:hypothetical protein
MQSPLAVSVCYVKLINVRIYPEKFASSSTAGLQSVKSLVSFGLRIEEAPKVDPDFKPKSSVHAVHRRLGVAQPHTRSE